MSAAVLDVNFHLSLGCLHRLGVAFLWPWILRTLILDLAVVVVALMHASRRAPSSVLVMQNLVKSTSSKWTKVSASIAISSASMLLFKTFIRRNNFLIPGQ